VNSIKIYIVRILFCEKLYQQATRDINKFEAAESNAVIVTNFKCYLEGTSYGT